MTGLKCQGILDRYIETKSCSGLWCSHWPGRDQVGFTGVGSFRVPNAAEEAEGWPVQSHRCCDAVLGYRNSIAVFFKKRAMD
jgi:hypothetical protein